MKKIFSILAVAAAMLFASSCDNNGMGFVYSVNADADADGVVNVTFVNGSLDLNGLAQLKFVWSNDTTSVLLGAEDNVLTFEEAVASKDEKVVEAAYRLENEIVEAFSAAAASGTYYVHFYGYAKETMTGLTFRVDRTFTNRENPEEVTVAE